MEYLYTFGPLVLIFALMYVILIRPQKKKENETVKMRASVQAGDEIITIGGLIGKITRVKGDAIVIQVGADKTKLEIAKWAISSVTKKSDVQTFVPESLREEAKEEETANTVAVKRKRFIKKENDELPKDEGEKISE